MVWLYYVNVLVLVVYVVFCDLLLGELELVCLCFLERNGDVWVYEEYFWVLVYFVGVGIIFIFFEELFEVEIVIVNFVVF